MASLLYFRALNDQRSRQLKAAMNADFEKAQAVKTATVMNSGQIAVDGQVYSLDTRGLGAVPGSEITVQNVGRPAVAQFIPTQGGGTVAAAGVQSSQVVTWTGDNLGVSDHGQLTGLLGDDHPQYLTTLRHGLPELHGATVVDHGSIGGLADDDHAQYLNTTRHDTTVRHTLGTVVPHDDHGLLSGLGDDDHTQYLNLTRHDTVNRHTLGTVVPHDDHGLLLGLGDDDHSQYLHLSLTRTVTARHDFQGGLNLGSASEDYQSLLQGERNTTDAVSTQYGIQIFLNLNAASSVGAFGSTVAVAGNASRPWIYGMHGSAVINTAGVSITEVVGGQYQAGMFQAGTANTVVGLDSRPYMKVAGTVTDFIGIRVGGEDFTTGLATNYYGLLLKSPTSAGITTAYGIKVEDLSIGMNNYAIHTGTGEVSFGGNLNVDGITLLHEVVYLADDLRPLLPNTSNIGSSAYPFLSGHISELYGTRFVEETIQVIGGRWLVLKSSALLTAAITSANASINVSSGLYAVNDYLVLNEPGKYEVMRVTSVAGSTLGVTRNVDGSGANSWGEGSVVANLGGSGGTAGWIEALGGSQASLSIWAWTGTAYADRRETVRLGDLVGLADYGSNHRYGVFIGDYANGKWMSYDPTNSLRINGNALITGTVQASAIVASTLSAIATNTGALTVSDDLHLSTAGVFRSGATGYNTGQGFWLDNVGGAARLFIGDQDASKLLWDGTSLAIYAGEGSVTMDNDGFRIGGRSGGAIIGGEVYDIIGGVRTATGDFGLRLLDSSGLPRAALLTKSDGSIMFRLGAESESDYLLYTPGALELSGTIDANAGHLGSLDVDGILTLAPEGELRQGTGSWGSSFTGVRLWNDSGVGRIGGYNASVLQWYAGSDGRLYAGEGTVVLDAEGITIDPGDTGANAITWNTKAEPYGVVKTYLAGTPEYIVMEVAPGSTTYHGRLMLEALRPFGGSPTALRLYGDLDHASLLAASTTMSGSLAVDGALTGNNDGLDADSVIRGNNDANLVFVDAGTDRVGIGTGTPAEKLDVAGALRFTGDLKAVRGGVAYSGAVFVKRLTPLTSAAWDGDAFSTTAKTLIDTSAVFGVPAGVKAVLVAGAIRDSAAATFDGFLILSPNNVAGQGHGISAAPFNDRVTRFSMTVPCDDNGDFYYQTQASGTGTLDIWLEVWGYYV